VLTRALGRCRVWAVECEGGTLSATGDRADGGKRALSRVRGCKRGVVGSLYVCVRVYGMHDR
jgi:hypothetical protein